MEIICRIVAQGALTEREYTNRQTQQQERFASMPFQLQSGADVIYCEMVQEQARRQPVLPTDAYYKATLQASVRSWADQQGTTHYQTQLKLTSICQL